MKSEIKIKPSNNPRVEAPVAPFYHEMPLQIRFNDIDLLGHINNSVFITFMDLGKAHYFNDVLGDMVDWRHINLAIVNINVNFYAPGFVDSELYVLTAVRKISQRSLVLEQRIIDRAHDDEVKCIATTVMAGYNVESATSMAIDERWRQAFMQYENLQPGQ